MGPLLDTASTTKSLLSISNRPERLWAFQVYSCTFEDQLGLSQLGSMASQSSDPHSR